MTGATVTFHFADAEAEERFIEGYLHDAWDRFAASDYWDHGWFWPYGQIAAYDCGPDGGLVRFVFEGDLDALVAAERDRWDSISGLDRWESKRYDDSDAVATPFESLLAQQQDAKGPIGGDREYRYKALTARLALAYRAEFEEPLPAAPGRSDANPGGIGMWSMVHSVYVQCGYDWYDETDACVRALQNRLKSLAAYRGGDAARDEYERIRQAWVAFEAELDDWLAEQQTGEAAEP